jgi:hypothetical protein
MIYHLHYRMDRAGFRVIRSINQAFDPGMNERPGTHCARFDCSKQLTLVQAVVANSCTRFAQSDDFRMRGRVGIGQVPIAAATDDFAGANHDRAYRNFTRLQCTLRSAQSLFHKQFVSVCGNASGVCEMRVQGSSV